MDTCIVHDPLRISKVGGDSPINVAPEAKLPHQRLEEGRSLVKV